MTKPAHARTCTEPDRRLLGTLPYMVPLAPGSILMFAIVELAAVAGPVPLEEWDWPFQSDASLRVLVNAGRRDVWPIDTARGRIFLRRFSAALLVGDRAVAWCAADGRGAACVHEGLLIGAVQQEAAWVTASR